MDRWKSSRMFSALDWFLDFARHADGFVFMRTLWIEDGRVCVCVFQEKCWQDFIVAFTPSNLSLSLSTLWESSTGVLYFRSSADYSVLIDSCFCPPILFPSVDSAFLRIRTRIHVYWIWFLKGTVYMLYKADYSWYVTLHTICNIYACNNIRCIHRMLKNTTCNIHTAHV